jgi:hypothetical protein
MEKKSVLGVGLLLVALTVIGGSLYYSMQNKDIDETKKDDELDLPTSNANYDDFKLEYKYEKEGRWTYTVTGSLPNPCYSISTEAIVMESYPEQVIIRSKVTPPNPEMLCTQVIQEVLEEGEFEASEVATVRFEIE